jgi:hypothetical protein
MSTRGSENIIRRITKGGVYYRMIQDLIISRDETSTNKTNGIVKMRTGKMEFICVCLNKNGKVEWQEKKQTRKRGRKKNQNACLTFNKAFRIKYAITGEQQ